MNALAHTIQRWGMIGVGLILLGGCQTVPVVPEPPAWLGHVPGGQQELCAIGVSGPTFYTEDALVSSKAQAITELSRALEVKVKADMEVTQRGDNRSSDTKMVETSQFSSDVLLKEAQVREQWVHPGGNERYGVQGTVYTLVCMPLTR